MIRSFAAALAALTLCAAPAAAQDKALPRLLSVAGHGEVRATPDMAQITLGVLRTAPSAAAALALDNQAMADMMAALRAAGIEARDIQTSSFMVAPRYDDGQNGAEPPRITGYDVSNSVTVTVRKLALLGAVLDRAVELGSNQINGVTFSLAAPEPVRDEARKLAFADALRKARLYADAAGVALGPLAGLDETGNRPLPFYAKAMRAEALSASAVPIVEGEQVIAIDVAVAWEIR